MITQREILLFKKGKTTEFIDNLLVDAQQWSNFRALLQTQVRKARDLAQDFEENRFLCAEVKWPDGEKVRKNRKNRKRTVAGLVIDKLSNAITRMEVEVESEIKKLDEKTKEMIELVSIPLANNTIDDIAARDLTVSRNLTWFPSMKRALLR